MRARGKGEPPIRAAVVGDALKHTLDVPAVRSSSPRAGVRPTSLAAARRSQGFQPATGNPHEQAAAPICISY